MSEDSASSVEPTPDAARSTALNASRDRSERALLALLVGLAFSLAGAVDGIVLWSKRASATCPPLSGQTRCFSHPQAGLGIAITMVSLALGALMVLVCVLANNLLHELRTD
jgi:hypothetical protein